jgi:hypothetical protein
MSGMLRGFPEIVEGTLLSRGRLKHLVDPLYRQVDNTAGLLTANGRPVTGGTSALGRTVDYVELPPLFIAQYLIKPHEWRTDNLYSINARIQSLLGGIEGGKPE